MELQVGSGSGSLPIALECRSSVTWFPDQRLGCCATEEEEDRCFRAQGGEKGCWRSSFRKGNGTSNTFLKTFVLFTSVEM